VFWAAELRRTTALYMAHKELAEATNEVERMVARILEQVERWVAQDAADDAARERRQQHLTMKE
jgi:hypothetical protein